MAVDKVIKFYHGAKDGIQAKLDDGTINESDLVITSDTDELVYIDETKTQKTLGNAKSKNEYTVNLGGGTVGSLKDGDVIAAGTSLDDLIKKLTQKSVPASYTKPTVSAAVSAGKAAGNYEAGTEITTSIRGIFSQNDAGALTSLDIFQSGITAPIFSSSTSPAVATDVTFTLGDSSVTFNAKASYSDGKIKNDNLGQPSPNGQIKAGTVTSGNVVFSGKRNLFYGTGVGTAPAVTSAMVRALTGKKLAPTNSTVFEIPVSIGQQYIVFAYPATLRDVNQVMYVETNDTGMAQNFTKSTISVEGANGSTGVDYKVYTYSMDAPAAAGMTFKVTI